MKPASPIRPAFLAVMLCITLLTVCTREDAAAWGRKGHEIITRVAIGLLAPDERQELQRAIGSSDPEMIGNWADSVRNYRPETKPWHYVDIPRLADHYVAERDCAETCVIEAIRREMVGVLQGPKRSAARRESLLFLIHFMEDLHQPFHCYGNDDVGGNEVKLRYHDEHVSLHGLWDNNLVDELGRHRHRGFGLTWASAAEVANGLMRHAHAVQLRDDDLETWANESHVISQKAWLAPNSAVTSQYTVWARHVVSERLLLAGERTAAMLHYVLAHTAR